MIEAMKQALEALEMYLTLDTPEEAHMLETYIAPRAYAALKQAIEQINKQEPVAYMDSRDGCLLSAEDWTEYKNKRWQPLYIAPPKPEWVGLTDNEIMQMYCEPRSDREMLEFAREFEAKLKEKNHG
jgi:hypothetical protein